ncbi:MAG: hypothetical protein FJ295_20755 [Planctomycetes bacterium]|nr:hypothetical protein [Planctomycetota bacterium]
MIDFEVQRFTRHCSRSGRELLPGESFYSVLVQQGASVSRVDYAADAWEGPPDNSLGWWQSRVPDTTSRRIQWAPNQVMVEYFERLADDPQNQDLRYVLTLLMIRRRILRQEEVETDSDGQEWIRVFCGRNECHYRVKVAMPDESRGDAIQTELSKILFGAPADRPHDEHAGIKVDATPVPESPADGT